MNILVTGANGFIGSNIINQIKDHTLFKGTRNTIDLYCKKSVESFILKNKINCVIHCAIEGGSRLKEDTSDILYKNILIFENLISCYEHYDMFINISSGAEFDRRNDIINYSEKQLYSNIPNDYYGLSKNVISKLCINYNRVLNLRIFGCFGKNESPTRFIKYNLKNYISKKSIIIHQDKWMDFIYVDDVCKIIDHSVKKSIHDDINLSYVKKYKLSDIANIINKQNDYKVTIEIENKELGLSYTGNSDKLKKLNIELKGLEQGIYECYKDFV